MENYHIGNNDLNNWELESAYRPGDISQNVAAPVEAGTGPTKEGHGSGHYGAMVLRGMARVFRRA